MNRLDAHIADEIEEAFLVQGLRPLRKTFRDGTGACAVGAVAVGLDGFAARFNRSRTFAFGVTWGFDMQNCLWIAQSFARDMTMFDANNGPKVASDFSRGVRVGYAVAKRMFSEAPIEISPTGKLWLLRRMA